LQQAIPIKKLIKKIFPAYPDELYDEDLDFEDREEQEENDLINLRLLYLDTKKEKIKALREDASLIKDLQNTEGGLNEDDIIEIFGEANKFRSLNDAQKNIMKYLDNPSEEVQLKAVEISGINIKHIIDKGIEPSEEVKIKAVEDSPEAIRYIENPSKKVRGAALKKNPTSAIYFFKNPTESEVRSAFKYNPSIIKKIAEKGIELKEYMINDFLNNKKVQDKASHYFNESSPFFSKKKSALNFIINNVGNVSEETMMKIVEYEPLLLKSIIKKGLKPSERVILKALEQGYSYHTEIFKLLEEERINLSDKALREAFKISTYALNYIDNPSEEMQLEAIRRTRKAIRYIDNPSEKVQLEAVKGEGNDGKAILDMIETGTIPTEAVQLASVKETFKGLEYIIKIGKIKPSEDVQIAAIKKSSFNIQHIDNPSEKVQLEAIKDGDYLFKYIKNPTEKAKKLQEELWGKKTAMAFNSTSEAIQYLSDFTGSRIKIAVQSKGSTVTLYHMAKKPAYPVPLKDWYKERFPGIEKGIFLSDNPYAVWNHHPVRGNVYIYKVPSALIKEAGGLKRFDNAKEIVISQELWDKYQPRVYDKIDRKTFEEKARQYSYNKKPGSEYSYHHSLGGDISLSITIPIGDPKEDTKEKDYKEPIMIVKLDIEGNEISIDCHIKDQFRYKNTRYQKNQMSYDMIYYQNNKIKLNIENGESIDSLLKRVYQKINEAIQKASKHIEYRIDKPENWLWEYNGNKKTLLNIFKDLSKSEKLELKAASVIL
jgi:hypothetical protein